MKKRLLSILLALCLVVGLLPTVALAEDDGENSETYVAEVGGTKYETLLAAVNAAQAGETITVIADFDIDGAENTTYPMADGVTLDLNDHAVGIRFSRAIFTGKNITIKNGTIQSPTGKNNDYVLYVGASGYETSVSVENVSLKGGLNAVNAAVTMENVEVTMASTTKEYYAVYAAAGASVTIESGSYAGGTKKLDLYEAAEDGIVVYGGTFAHKPNNKYFAPGYTAVKNDDGTYTVCGVVKGETAYYTSLQAAVNADETDVTLMADMNENFSLPVGFTSDTFTLNLGAHTLSGTIGFPEGIVTASGKDEEGNCEISDLNVRITGTSTGNSIFLAEPILNNHAFLGWCYGTNNTSTYTDEEKAAGKWGAEPENIYHTHWKHSDLNDLTQQESHHVFEMDYRGTVPAAQTVTFASAVEGTTITSVEDSADFNASIEGLTVTITPESDVATKAADTYVETLHVFSSDGAVHTITVTLKINKAVPTVTITADPATLTGGGTVTVAASAHPEGIVPVITCVPSVTANEDGSYTLPDSTETYTFTAAYGEGTNYQAAAATCIVTVNAYYYYVPVVTPTTPTEPEKPVEPEQPVSHPFVDVPDGEWYSDGVQYVYTNGIMKGVNETGTVFDLNGSTSRAMLMTMLARMSGVDTSVGNTWDEIGMNWAVANGISDGTNGSAPITREQLVTMLYRYAGSPAVSDSALAALGRYSDYSALSNWAQYAMAWAVEKGIITNTDGKLLPGGTASRAMVATVLMRFCEL